MVNFPGNRGNDERLPEVHTHTGSEEHDVSVEVSGSSGFMHWYELNKDTITRVFFGITVLFVLGGLCCALVVAWAPLTAALAAVFTVGIIACNALALITLIMCVATVIFNNCCISTSST